MDQDLLNEAMILYEQEQRQEQQQQQSTPDCLHDFEYDSSYGQSVCFNCDLIDPKSFVNSLTRLFTLYT